MLLDAAGAGGHALLQHLCEALANQLVDQRILVDKVRVERGAIDRGARGNILHRDVVKGLLGLQAHKGIQ